jgi:hypothetical protein
LSPCHLPSIDRSGREPLEYVLSRLAGAALLEESVLVPLLPLLVAFLVPVAAYCLLLAAINRRPNPVMISGSWDAAGLLFAASGGLLFVGPTIIMKLYIGEVSTPASGRSVHDVFLALWLVWLAYYVVLIAGSIALLWLRRGKTVIYNVSRLDFERVLTLLLDRLGLEWNRLGNRVFVGAGQEAAKPVTLAYEHAFASDPLVAAEAAVALPAPRPPGEAVLDIEPFASMCHVTLHWRRQEGLIREELEAELERALAQMAAPDHPTGGWLMGLAGFLLALIFMGIFFMVFGGYLQGRH